MLLDAYSAVARSDGGIGVSRGRHNSVPPPNKHFNKFRKVPKSSMGNLLSVSSTTTYRSVRIENPTKRMATSVQVKTRNKRRGYLAHPSVNSQAVP